MNQPRRPRRAGAVKGRALLLFRLARQDIRHHFAQAVLLVVAIAAATTVLSLAFALNGVNSNPYQQTKAATKGPDVVAQSGNDPYTSVTSPADLAALVALNHAQGVAAHSGPYPIVGATGPVGPVMRSTGIVASVQVEGRRAWRGSGRPAQSDGRDVDPTRGRGGRAVLCRDGEPASRPDDHAERSPLPGGRLRRHGGVRWLPGYEPDLGHRSGGAQPRHQGGPAVLLSRTSSCPTRRHARSTRS